MRIGIRTILDNTAMGIERKKESISLLLKQGADTQVLPLRSANRNKGGVMDIIFLEVMFIILMMFYCFYQRKNINVIGLKQEPPLFFSI